MIAKLLPVIFLLLGTGAGTGAGLFLGSGSTLPIGNSNAGAKSENGSDAAPREPMLESHGTAIDTSATEFVAMSNQFVIPVVKNDMIAALVVITLSLETQVGASDKIYAREPKLRDAFLRVMFDHANMGGFHGAFTDSETLELLRSALREVAHKEIGQDILDVLIVDIIRQDT